MGAGIFAAPIVFRGLLYWVGLQNEQPLSVVGLTITAMIFATVFVLLYSYVALSGGVMDREARRRYLGEGAAPRQ